MVLFCGALSVSPTTGRHPVQDGVVSTKVGALLKDRPPERKLPPPRPLQPLSSSSPPLSAPPVAALPALERSSVPPPAPRSPPGGARANYWPCVLLPRAPRYLLPEEKKNPEFRPAETDGWFKSETSASFWEYVPVCSLSFSFTVFEVRVEVTAHDGVTNAALSSQSPPSP